MRRLPALRDFLPHGLFGRTVLIILLPVLLLQVLATYIFFDRHWTRMTERLAFSVAGEVAAISEQIEAGAYNSRSVETLKHLMARHMDVRVTFTPGLRRVDLLEAPGRGPGLEDTLERAIARQVARPFAVHIDLGRKRVDIDVQLKAGVLHASMPQRRMYDSSGYIFVLWLNGLALLFFLVSIVFMRKQIWPIRRLAIAAERFGKGADVQPFKPVGAREVRRATEAFFSMKARITRAVQQRTAMLAGISHDLRTPLTRMKLQLAMMPDNSDIAAMRSDIEDMEQMVEGYLAFMRGEGDEPSAPCDIAAMLRDVAAGFRRQNFEIVPDVPEVLVAEVRPKALTRALVNLVENARKYAKGAWLSGAYRDDGVEIVLDDDGPGIPPDRYDDAFRPFLRLEESRNRKTGGSGLGLAIAQDIVLGHGGHIQLDRSPMGGLRVVVHLPL